MADLRLKKIKKQNNKKCQIAKKTENKFKKKKTENKF
jgi:hypothetical protein